MIEDLPNNPLGISLISVLVGFVLSQVATKLSNKTGTFRYTVRTNHIGLTAEDPIFGTVKVTWQENDFRNLYTSTIQLENATNKDFEKVEFKVYTETETILLNERAFILNTAYSLEWTDDFKKRMLLNKGETPTQEQLNLYNHSREYIIPIFNRGQIVEITYLCTRPNDNQLPLLWLSTLTKGIRLKEIKNFDLIWGVPKNSAIMRGVLLAIFTFLFCGFFVESIWLATSLSMIVGLGGAVWGAMLYKGERYLRNLISG